jgi:hypothetical protein
MSRCLRGRLGATFLLSLLLVFAACSDGRKAEKLDRETSLALLREGTTPALRGPTWQLDLLIFDTGPAEAARLAFLKTLQPDLVKLVSTTEAPAPGFTFMLGEKRAPVKRYEFEPADPKLAAFVMNGATMKMVQFAVADPDYKSVTGIVQEGSRAVAMVDVAFAPNAAYRAIQAAIGKAGPNPGFILSPLPVEAELGKTVSREVPFRRYDDGWRVEVRKSILGY